MQFCISITDSDALKAWNSIPKQKRSRFVEEMLLNNKQYETNVNEIKEMLLDIMSKSSSNTSNINFDSSAIDEILNM